MQSADIWYQLGRTCSEMGLIERATEAFGKAIDQKMQSGLLYNELAEIYVLQGNFAGALPLYQKSLEIYTSPKDLSQVWGRIGNAYTRVNEYGKAIQAFQKADEIEPKKSVEKAVSGGFTSGQLDESTPYLQEEMTTEDEPFAEIEESMQESTESVVIEESEVVQESANVWNELGLVLFKVGAYEDAIDAYQKAIRINPSIGYLYSNLGQVYSIQGKLSEAVQQYEKSLSLLESNKDKSVSWTRLGDIYRQLGNYENAEPAYLLADVLLQTTAVYKDEFRQVKLETISTNSDPVRGMEEIGDLVQSVRTFGIIQPLLVCPGRNEPGKFTLISGRRRLEAARMAGLKEVPVILRKATNQEILELSISENIHHLAVTPFELAQAYIKMANEFELSIEEISDRLGRSCHSVANVMKMLEPPEPVKQIPTDAIQEIGQKVIDRSLAVLQAQNSEISEILPGQALSYLYDETENQIADSIPAMESVEEPTTTLWYLESEEERLPAPKLEEIFPEAVSLLSRARQVLKGNPHSNRLGADSSYRG